MYNIDPRRVTSKRAYLSLPFRIFFFFFVKCLYFAFINFALGDVTLVEHRAVMWLGNSDVSIFMECNDDRSCFLAAVQ